MSPRAQSTFLTSVLLLAVLLLPALLVAQPTPPGSGGGGGVRFELFGTFFLELDGSADDQARLYQSPRRPGVVVRTPEIANPFVLVPQGRRLEIFAPSSFLEHPDGSLELIPGEQPTRVDTFELGPDGPIFRIDGHDARLRAKPPWLGPATREQLFEHNPAYRIKADTAAMVPDQLAALKQVEDAIQVKIYFGSWCSVCSEVMPGILRLDRELAEAEAPYSFEYYGLPQGYDDPEARARGIDRVPIAWVYRNGREIARIEPQTWRYPTMALFNAVAGVKIEPQRP